MEAVAAVFLWPNSTRITTGKGSSSALAKQQQDSSNLTNDVENMVMVTDSG